MNTLALTIILAVSQAQSPRAEADGHFTRSRELLCAREYRLALEACDAGEKALKLEPGRWSAEVDMLRGEIYLGLGKSDYAFNEKAFYELSGHYHFNRDRRHGHLLALAAARVQKTRVARLASTQIPARNLGYVLRREVDLDTLPTTEDLKQVEARACVLLAAYPKTHPLQMVEYASWGLVLLPENRAAQFLLGQGYAELREYAQARIYLAKVAAGSAEMAKAAARHLSALRPMGSASPSNLSL